jgi:hypothetical protein
VSKKTSLAVDTPVQETIDEHSISSSSMESNKKLNESPFTKSVLNWKFKDTNEVWQDKNIWSFIENHSVEGQRKLKL